MAIVKKNGFCYADFMNKVFNFYVRLIFLLFPIAFLPMLTDGFGLGKNLVLGVLAFVGLILWGVKSVVTKEKVIRTNKLFWLFLVFVIWTAVTFFRLGSGARAVSLMMPMGMGTAISMLVLFFVLLQVNDKEETKKQFLFLTISGVLVGLVSLVVFLIPTKSLPLSLPKTNPLISITAGWSLAGSVLAEAVLFLFLILGWLKKLIKKIKGKTEVTGYLVEAVATAFFLLLLLLDVYKIIKLGWMNLDLNSSWVIAVEVLKRYPIFGIGVGNFLEAFNLYRPVSFNSTAYWSSTFSVSSMGILQVWTELGLVGLALMVYFLAMVLKLRKKSIKFFQLGLFLAVLLFLPLNIVTAFLVVWLLSENFSGAEEAKLVLNVGERNVNIMPYIVMVIVLGISGFCGFLMVKMFLGDFYMMKSLRAAAKNDGTSTYQLQIKAIGFSPNVAGYRKVYSQTNLSLAETILNQTTVSDEDKEKASTLVQQAVREAKAAVTLNQKNPDFWYNLAGIYKSLVGLVDNAAVWSYQAYQQTVLLDTVSPTYYLDMGGLLYAAGEYDQAERAFEQAVTDKSDYANAWYNWAYAAKQQNKLNAAVTRLEEALKLVPADSEDYQTALKELDSWKEELAKETAASEKQAAATGQQQQQTTDLTTPVTSSQGEVPTSNSSELSPSDIGTDTVTGTPEAGKMTEEDLAPPVTGN